MAKSRINSRLNECEELEERVVPANPGYTTNVIVVNSAADNVLEPNNGGIVTFRLALAAIQLANNPTEQSEVKAPYLVVKNMVGGITTSITWGMQDPNHPKEIKAGTGITAFPPINSIGNQSWVNEIDFAIGAASLTTGPQTITLNPAKGYGDLPAILPNTRIMGYTQLQYERREMDTVNYQPTPAINGGVLVQINGSQLTNGTGFTFQSYSALVGGDLIQGLSMYGFSTAAINLGGAGSVKQTEAGDTQSNTVQISGNLIGLLYDGLP